MHASTMAPTTRRMALSRAAVRRRAVTRWREDPLTRRRQRRRAWPLCRKLRAICHRPSRRCRCMQDKAQQRQLRPLCGTSGHTQVDMEMHVYNIGHGHGHGHGQACCMHLPDLTCQRDLDERSRGQPVRGAVSVGVAGGHQAAREAEGALEPKSAPTPRRHRLCRHRAVTARLSPRRRRAVAALPP